MQQEGLKSLEKDGLRTSIKYNFESLTDKLSAKSYSRTNLGDTQNGIYIGKYRSHTRKDGSVAFSFKISIGSKIVERTRWIKGDRVAVFYDRYNKTMLLKRVASGGHGLTTETSGRLSTSMTYMPGFPEFKDKEVNIRCIPLNIDHPLWAEGVPFLVGCPS